MKIRTRARYSLRMMVAIARLSADDAPVGLGDVARRCGVSRRYLEQLVGPLRNASLLRSVSGRGGGYRLARSASEIKVAEIMAAAVGPVEVTECARDASHCLFSAYCNCGGLWALINARINEILESYSLADILSEDFLASVAAEVLRPGPSGTQTQTGSRR